MSPFFASLLDPILGPTGRLRVRVSQTLLGIAVLLLIDLLLAVSVWQGQADGLAVGLFAVGSMAGSLAFYGLVRSGVSERLSTEPSLSMPQMLYAMLCVCWAYAVGGPTRSALLSLMPLILSFGMFALDARTARGLSALGTLLLGGVMSWRVLQDPVRQDLIEEAAGWLFMAVAMAAINVLAQRLGRMRARLREQKDELSQALERIRDLATRDTLTGLLNRRAMQDELLRETRRAVRHGGPPVVVALADLDRFKLINDSFGHGTGDRVLQAFAQVARSELRGEDIVARWGGEEFLFLLPQADERQAQTCLARIRRALGAAQVRGLPAGHPLDFSAGLSVCRGVDDIEAAIDRADQAMYRAKMRGRGRTDLGLTERAAVPVTEDDA